MKTELKFKELFDDLTGYLFAGDFAAVNFWFKNNIKSKKDEDKVLELILSSKNFYSFSSRFISAAEIKKETVKRNIIILDKFSLDNQFKLLDNIAIFEDLEKKHIDVLKINGKMLPKKLFKNRDLIVSLVIKLFYEKDFNLIRYINKKFNINVMDFGGKKAYFHKMTEIGDSFFYMDFDGIKVEGVDFEIKPKHDLIINYSKDKYNFLIETNTDLPEYKEVIVLKNIFEKGNFLRGMFEKEVRAKVLESIEFYKNFIDFNKLNEKIKNKKDFAIKSKIKV
jgi:hypothetical protein